MAIYAATDALRVAVTGAFSDEGELRDALAAHDGIEVLTWSAELGGAAAALASPDLDAVLLGTYAASEGSDEAVAATVRHEVGAIRRQTTAPIVLLVQSAPHALVDAAIEAGVEDVLVLPQMAEAIEFAIRKAKVGGRRASVETVGGGEIVTVFSPKGGTGKTVLATNLATVLATTTDERVLLIDLDLQFGDAAIMLGVDPERTLSSLVLDPGELDAEKLAGYTVEHRSGLHVLPAPLRPEEAELVTESKVLSLLAIARQEYDIVVVDTSPFFYGPMLALLEPTDHLLLLCGLDVPTLKNVRLSLRTLELLGFPRDRTNLVLNRVAPKVGVTAEDVERALDLPVSFEIPNDPVVAQAVNRGTPAALLDDDSDFADAVGDIADMLSAEEEGTPAPRPHGTRFRLFGGNKRLLEGRA